MPIPEEPKRELHSTYVVQDRSNEEEMHRVKVQDQMVTASMGGPLSEQPDPSTLRRVLGGKPFIPSMHEFIAYLLIVLAGD